MLHYRKDPKTVFKSYTYAAAARIEECDFYYFTPGMVDMEQEKIKGLFYENGAWVEKEVPYPDVIFNAGGALTEMQMNVHDHLSERIPFTSHPIGDKISVFERILKGKDFAQYLIPSEKVLSLPRVFELIDEYKELIIKPVAGARGIDVISIKKKDNLYELKENKNTITLSKTDLEDKLANLIKDDDFLAQPYIESKTKEGFSLDFRLHVQKSREGMWILTTIFPRIAANGIVTNIHSGGYVSPFTIFLETQFGNEYYNMKRYLERFSILFANHFDSLYKDPLDELGIDVCLDTKGKIWILEVNWRPGTPVLFHGEIDVAKNTILYCKYLEENKGNLLNLEVE